MPAPINTLPAGLNSLLGIKSAGEYPRELAQLLQGTFDLRPLYEINGGQVIQGSVFGAHVNGPIQWGPTGAVSGPAPIYHIEWAAAHLSCTGVGAAGSVSIGFNDSSGNYIPLTPTLFAAQALANTSHIVSVQFRDVWLRAGNTLVVWGSNIAGAPLVSLAFVSTRYDV